MCECEVDSKKKKDKVVSGGKFNVKVDFKKRRIEWLGEKRRILSW